MNRFQAALAGLSDVEGVIGSFVITESGALLGSNLPSVFDAQVFADAGPRLARLVQASAALSEGLRGCVLKFSEHKLFVKEVAGAFLGVLLASGASLPALRVATNLVGRKLSALIAEAPLSAGAGIDGGAPITDRSPTTAPAVVMTPPPPSAAPASGGAVPASRQMFYRGRPVG